MKFRGFILTFMVLTAYSINVAANHHEENDHHHEEGHETQEAHLHGYGESNVVIDGNDVEIHFDSPSANIVGFEYKASTQKEMQAVSRAKSTLETPDKLFSFKGTKCVATEVNVDMSALLPSEHEEDHHHDTKEKADIHSDVEAEYKFTCKDGKKLKSIKMLLLDEFPGLETFKVDWVKGNKQGSKKLFAGGFGRVKFK